MSMDILDNPLKYFYVCMINNISGCCLSVPRMKAAFSRLENEGSKWKAFSKAYAQDMHRYFSLGCQWWKGQISVLGYTKSSSF